MVRLDELDPADRKLGELLQSLELVDAQTLSALWAESRRQHRPLRQVLLAGGYLNRTSSEIAADFICAGRAVSQIRQ